MAENESVIIDLECRISEMTVSEIRKLELLAYRAIGLLRRMGLPENIDEGIAKLQRLIMTIRLTHSALIALEAALIPGAGVLKLVGAGLTMAVAGVTAYDTVRGM